MAPMERERVKRCWKCTQTLPSDQFGNDKSRSDGLTSICRICKNKEQRKYEKRNREKINTYWRNRYQTDEQYRQKMQDLNRGFYYRLAEEDPERLRLKSRLKEQKRRTRKENNGIYKVTEKEMKHLLTKPCYNCGAKAEHIDHVIPIAKGGRHSIGNLAPMCSPCNTSKGSKFYSEYRYRR